MLTHAGWEIWTRARAPPRMRASISDSRAAASESDLYTLGNSRALRTWRQIGSFEVDFGDAEGLFEFLDPPASPLDLVSARARVRRGLQFSLVAVLAAVVSVTFVVALCAGGDRVAPPAPPLASPRFVNVASFSQLEIIVVVVVVSVGVSASARPGPRVDGLAVRLVEDRVQKVSGGTSFGDLDEVVVLFAVGGRELAGVQVDAGMGQWLLYGRKERRQLGSSSRTHRHLSRAIRKQEQENPKLSFSLSRLGAPEYTAGNGN